MKGMAAIPKKKLKSKLLRLVFQYFCFQFISFVSFDCKIKTKGQCFPTVSCIFVSMGKCCNACLLFRDQIFILIRWHLGNIKNTHLGDHRSVPRQSYIETPMYDHSDVCMDHSHIGALMYDVAIHQSASHIRALVTSERQSYIGASYIAALAIHQSRPSEPAL